MLTGGKSNDNVPQRSKNDETPQFRVLL